MLDMLGSVAVHAVAGRRDQYRPLKSCICNGSDPLEVSSTFKSRYGFKELYVADLDAILGKEPSLSLVQQIKNNFRFCKIIFGRHWMCNQDIFNREKMK